MWAIRFPGSDSGTDTSAESPPFRLIKPSQFKQSSLDSPCRLRFVISISRAHTRRPPAPLSLSLLSAAPSSACPVSPLLSSQIGEGIVRWAHCVPGPSLVCRSSKFCVYRNTWRRIHPHLNTPTNRRGVVTRTGAIWTQERTMCSKLQGLLF